MSERIIAWVEIRLTSVYGIVWGDKELSRHLAVCQSTGAAVCFCGSWVTAISP